MELPYLRATRNNAIKLLLGLSHEQLNRIPEGFNNNLIWNAGHMVATMELLIYGLSGNRTPSDKDFIDRYRKGSKPEGDVSPEEVQVIFEKLKTSITQLENDWNTVDFANFKTYPTSYGITLNSVEDALKFNGMHEAMHIGAMIALRKFV